MSYEYFLMKMMKTMNLTYLTILAILEQFRVYLFAGREAMGEAALLVTPLFSSLSRKEHDHASSS
jgi:hypothetical protein